MQTNEARHETIEDAIAYLLANTVREGFHATSKALEVAMIAVRIDIENNRQDKQS